MAAVRATLTAATASLMLLAGVGCGVDDPSLSEERVAGARVLWGEPAGGDPIGLVMLIHGGGWQHSDSRYEEQKRTSTNFLGRGYATVAIGYDEGARGFRQVVEVYKEARKRYPDLPVCATGVSAGGHLSLMLATRRPDLDCVLAVAAPTDITSIAAQDPGGDEVYNAAVKAFGKDQLARFSPALHADRIKAKVLLINAEADPLVPADQGRELARALPGMELLLLPPGPVRAPFAHFGGVQPDAQSIVTERQFEFLNAATQGG